MYNKKRKKKSIDGFANMILGQEQIISNLQHNINIFGKSFDIPIDPKFKKLNTHSWFDIYEAINNNFKCLPKNVSIKYDDLSADDGYTTTPFKLNLSDEHKLIINKWIDCYTLMYNATINYFKFLKFNDFKLKNIKQLKKSLYHVKNAIINSSGIMIHVNGTPKLVKIPSHELDYAINDANNRLQSCLTNLRNKNIKHFRLRYIKLSKKDRITKIEKMSFVGKSFCVRVFGNEIKCNIENFNYEKNAETTAIIKRRHKEYYLLMKNKKDFSNYPSPKNDTIIGLDLGIRKVATGYANDKVVEIGGNVKEVFERRLKIIQKIYKSKISEEKKRRLAGKKFGKMKRMATDMRWKIAKYLTDNYSSIIVGNFSTKKMGENGKVNKRLKTIGGLMSQYKMKNAIKYYCMRKGLEYKEVNEAGTTQCCGKCGYRKRDVGAAEVYECDKCGIKIGRDINSGRSMIITSIK